MSECIKLQRNVLSMLLVSEQHNWSAMQKHGDMCDFQNTVICYNNLIILLKVGYPVEICKF